MVGAETGRLAPAIHDLTTVFTRHDVRVRNGRSSRGHFVDRAALASMPARSRDNAVFVGMCTSDPFKESAHARDVCRWTRAASAAGLRINIEIDYLRITNGRCVVATADRAALSQNLAVVFRAGLPGDEKRGSPVRK
jgi:hypothetical protein